MKKRYYYIVYTFAFLFISAIIFSPLIINDCSLIKNGDGWTQHFKALVYYSNYLKQIIYNLINNHQLIIPEWDYNIGEGTDILNALHYYGVGDPIAALSVFVPIKYMHYFYSFSCILRMYLAGLSFSILAFNTKIENTYGILAGTLTYVFCAWELTNAARHPFFLNPSIYLPLMILGVEYILNNKKPYIFIISTAIAAMTNFYFFYIMAVILIIYTITRLVADKTEITTALKKITRIGVAALHAMCIAGIIFLPLFIIFANDARISVEQEFHMFYPLEHYSILLSTFTTTKVTFWIRIGLTIPAIIAIFTLFIKKNENKSLRALVIISIIIMLFPILGRILNGMSYMTNRWIFAFDLLGSYILSKEWDSMFHLNKKEWISITCICIIYYVACSFTIKSNNEKVFITIPITVLTLIILCIHTNHLKIRNILMIILCMICSINLGYQQYGPDGESAPEHEKSNQNTTADLYNTELILAKQYPSDGRITGHGLTRNANIIENVSTTQYYWSISNPYLQDYRTDLCMADTRSFNLTGYDDRTSAITLSSVDRYITPADDTNGMPYGFSYKGSEMITSYKSSEITKDKEYSLYENQHSLPLGYTYDNFITNNIYDMLDPVQKQEMQLNAVYTDVKVPINRYTGLIPDYELPFEIQPDNNNVTKTDTGFIVTEKNATVTLSFQGNKKSETYVYFNGFDFQMTPDYDLYFGNTSVDPLEKYSEKDWTDLSEEEKQKYIKEKHFYDYRDVVGVMVTSSHGVSKQISYISPDASFTSGRHNYIINLGYQKEPENQITITFPYPGIYTMNLKVYNIPIKGYAKKINALKETILENVELNVNEVKGTINADKAKALVISIPYYKGWTAFIDNQPYNTFVANKRHIGLIIPKGKHDVRLKYRTPYKKEGTILSLIGILLLPIYRIKKPTSKNADL